MIRATLACSLLTLCVAAPAVAAGEDASSEASRFVVEEVAPARSDDRGPLASASQRELEPSPLTLDARRAGATAEWCERPDDPRCAPASPAPASVRTPASLPAALPANAPPRVAADAGVSDARGRSGDLLGPRAGIANRIERPPT